MDMEEFTSYLTPEVKAIIIVSCAVILGLIFLCPPLCCRGGYCCYRCKKHREHVYELEEMETGMMMMTARPSAPSDLDKHCPGFYQNNLKNFSTG